ncbi:DUF1007 family protein [Phytohalomonas tamaricis]|uniref:DUF1007 family protein n=1 Tax=Phytohalomonas tamaricis TaxID=2081032 RepID=UPI000D0AFEFF|nr:DUF1007 family protein [Phytohalomonas tamaricis]
MRDDRAATGRRSQWLGIALLVGLFTASPVNAHPHGWVDLRVGVRFDDQGRVIALEQAWMMDPFYSLTLIEELSQVKDGTNMNQRLDALGAEILANLKQEHYLSHVKHDGHDLAFGQVDEYNVMQNGKRIEFDYVLPLAEPLALDGKPLRYRIYDATYFIEFLHDDQAKTPLRLINAPEGCEGHINKADPDPALVAKASAIDIDAQAPDGLGSYFADTGVVTCPAT